MNFFQAIVAAFQNYANFRGRASRPEFWYFYLFTLLAAILFEALKLDAAYVVFSLVTLVPYIAVTTRRLHDVNRSGWWQLLVLTVIGIIPLVYWLAKAPVHDGNRFNDTAPADVVL